MEDDAVKTRRFRWTCPYCGTYRVKSASIKAGEQQSIIALRSHVIASEGDGHGPVSELPPDFEDLTLTDCVELVGE